MIKNKNLSRILHWFLLLFCAFQVYSCKNDNIEVPKQLYDKIETTKFQHAANFATIYGEILNNTEYVITRLVFRFELRKYDDNWRLRQLYKMGDEAFKLPDFSNFVKKIQTTEKQKIFYDAISKEHDIGSFSDFVKAVNDFNEKLSDNLILARKLDLNVQIEPTYSVKFEEEIGSTFYEEGLMYTFQLQEAYGVSKNKDE